MEGEDIMKLQELRKKEGLTTTEMAEKLGITQGHYCHLENGSRRLTEKLVGRVEEVFRINKVELENDFMVSNPYLSVINNWIWKIRIKDKPVTQAFINDIGYLRIKNLDENIEVLEAFIKYIVFSIGSSIEKEFSKDPKMIKYLVTRLQR